MDVREPTVEDAADLTRVHAAAWRSAYRGILPDDVLDDMSTEPSDDSIAAWRDRIETPYNRMLVATAGGEVVGYTNVRIEEAKSFVDDGAAELKEIYVDPDSWGEGVGTALLEATLEELPEEVTTVFLETLSGNDLAAGFYEARGFERTGESTFEVAGTEYSTDVYRLQLE